MAIGSDDLISRVPRTFVTLRSSVTNAAIFSPGGITSVVERDTCPEEFSSVKETCAGPGLFGGFRRATPVSTVELASTNVDPLTANGSTRTFADVCKTGLCLASILRTAWIPRAPVARINPHPVFSMSGVVLNVRTLALPRGSRKTLNSSTALFPERSSEAGEPSSVKASITTSCAVEARFIRLIELENRLSKVRPWPSRGTKNKELTLPMEAPARFCIARYLTGVLCSTGLCQVARLDLYASEM